MRQIQDINSEMWIRTDRYPVGAGSPFGDSPHKSKNRRIIKHRIKDIFKVNAKTSETSF